MDTDLYRRLTALERTVADLQRRAIPRLSAMTSYTPAAFGVTTAGVGTYTTQTGHYWRVGSMVVVMVALTWTAHTGTGSLRITLPVVSAAPVVAVKPFISSSALSDTDKIMVRTVATVNHARFDYLNNLGVTTAVVITADAVVHVALVYEAGD